jgi:predicted ArsR family transcriptional regulator
LKPTLPERALYALAFRAEKDPRARRVLVAIVRAMFRAVAFERRRGGTRLLNVARIAAVRFGKWRAPVLRDALGVDVDDMADLARLQDWEDRAFGVTGHWTEKARTRATKCETACPFAEVAREAPELCSDVVHALETATFRELNPSYRLLPLESLLSKGAPRCEFRHELD